MSTLGAPASSTWSLEIDAEFKLMITKDLKPNFHVSTTSMTISARRLPIWEANFLLTEFAPPSNVIEYQAVPAVVRAGCPWRSVSTFGR